MVATFWEFILKNISFLPMLVDVIWDARIEYLMLVPTLEYKLDTNLLDYETCELNFYELDNLRTYFFILDKVGTFLNIFCLSC